MDFLFLAKQLGLASDVVPSDELMESCSFLRINATDVIIKARFLMLLALVSLLCFSLFFSNVLFLPFSILIPVIVYYFFTESPKFKAREERLRNLGYAPEIVTVLGSSLELNPNLERSIGLVASNCSGRISHDFSVSVRNSLLKGYSLIDGFTDVINDWGNYSEGFRHGLQLIKASLLESDSRTVTIERGLSAFFNGLINDLRKYLAKTKTHTLVLFSFGTIVPLVLISLLPIIGLLNAGSNPLIISAFLIVNLVLVFLYSSFILRGRPATFSQVDVSRIVNAPKKGFLRLGFRNDSFDVPALPYCLLLFLLISFPSILYFFSPWFNVAFPFPKEYAMMPLVLGFAFSLSVYFYGSSHFLIKARRDALRVESELLDIVYMLASKLEERRSFEDSLKHVMLNSKGKLLVSYLRNAYSSIKDFLISPEEAVMRELGKTGSNRSLSVFGLVFHALRQGVDNSARSVFRIYEHFSRMLQAESEHKGLLEQVLSMMRITSLFFAPLISAFIVLMQGLIEVNTSSVNLGIYGFNFFGNGVGFDVLGLILGFYVIGLCIVLTFYEVRLSNGPDSVLLKHELSKNILISCTVYLSALIIAGLVL